MGEVTDRARYIYSRLVVGTAGLVAEEPLLAELRAQYGIVTPPDTKSDQKEMLGFMWLLIGDTVEAARPVLEAATTCAEEILTAHWPVVQRVAQALGEAGDLSGPQIIGPVPAGHLLHHDCSNPSCVNVQHMRPVTPAQHAALHRATHCAHGHAFDAQNTYTYWWGGGWHRACVTCRQQRYQARRQAASRLA